MTMANSAYPVSRVWVNNKGGRCLIQTRRVEFFCLPAGNVSSDAETRIVLAEPFTSQKV
jgi:hypothetical protein